MAQNTVETVFRAISTHDKEFGRVGRYSDTGETNDHGKVLKQHTAKKIVHGRSLTRHTAKI
jgi:hypothetical protein